jgi:hypothetical protein
MIKWGKSNDLLEGKRGRDKSYLQLQGKHPIESKQQKAARQKVGKHQPIGPMALW